MGATVSGTSDQTYFVYQSLPAAQLESATWMARVSNVMGGTEWKKIGLMVRASLAPGAVFASLFYFPVNNMDVATSRFTESGSLQSIYGAIGQWIRLERRGGNSFRFASSLDGQTWTSVAESVIVNLPSSGQLFWGVSTVAKFGVMSFTASNLTLAAGVCGDGVKQAWEQCDDGNINDGDCCSKWCQLIACAPT